MRTEQDITSGKVGPALRRLSPRWAGDGLKVQQTRVLDGRPADSPDVLVHPSGAAPVIVEAKFERHASALEQQARGRLGVLVDGQPVETVLMVLYPESWREATDEELDNQLVSAQPCLRWALLSTTGRLPSQGWSPAGLQRIADLIEVSGVSASSVAAASSALADGVRDAGALIHRTGRADRITELLRQHHDPTVSDIQSCRMAAMLLVNAFIFQDGLADSVMHVPTVVSVRTERVSLADSTQVLRPSVQAVRMAWKAILQINWWPIFDIATQILEELAPRNASQVLDRAVTASERMASANLGNLQDAVGQMFGRLVTDRDLLKAHYTRVEAAALLAEVAVANMDVTDWSDTDAVTGLRVADFACGTGMLLTAAYRSIAARVRRAGGDDRSIHAAMVERVFTGMDVLPAATHLTAMALSSKHPDLVYGGTGIHLVPLGCDTALDGRTTINLGALDMLRDGANVMSLLGERSDLRVAATADEARSNTRVGVPPQSCDLIIMNPPYGRATKHSRRGAIHSGVTTDVVPPFAPFGASPEHQRIMADRLAKLSRGSRDRAAHGNAGLGSYFFDIAHAKLRPGGVLAFVLPLTVSTGRDWGGLRSLLAAHYDNITFIGLAGSTDEERQFSADTGIAELLVVARRRRTLRSDGDIPAVRWVTLFSRPTSEMEALIDAGLIVEAEPSNGGTAELRYGSDLIGRAITAGIDDGGLLAIHSDPVRDAASGLMTGKVRLGRFAPIPIPSTRLGRLGGRGPIHRDIATQRGSVGSRQTRAPFYIDPIPEHGATYYPLLWAHHAPSGRESRLEVRPDRSGTVREGQADRARRLFRDHATTFHLNQDFDFGSQMLAACMTPDRVLGGRAWPGYKLTDPRHGAFLTLWMNTTLGLISFWVTGTRQQKRRALVTVTRQARIPVYDPRTLSDTQLDQAGHLYEELKAVRFLPANQADQDTARHRLDAAVLCDLLRLHEQANVSADDFTNALAVLRTAWCSEPHIAAQGRTLEPATD